MMKQAIDWTAADYVITHARNVPLISYEAGQSLVDPNDSTTTPLYITANRDPRMGAATLSYLQQLKIAGLQLINYYNFVGVPAKWGSWGSIENILQSTSTTYKYNALTNFINANPCWWQGCTQPGAPDTISPTVSITAPSNNASLSHSVQLAAIASDNAAVTSVQFKIDGANLGSALTVAPYSLTWDTTSVADGSHTITVVAADAAGNTASAAIGVTTGNAAPVISGVSSGLPSVSSTTIAWTTNSVATSQVFYGTTTAYSLSTSSVSLVTSHTLMIGNFLGGRTYHFLVVSTDAFGNTSTSSDYTLNTLPETYVGPGDIASGAAAWWGLRAYTAASIGTSRVIKLRRSTDGATQVFTTVAGGGLDLDAISAFRGATTTNLYVNTLYDQTGHGNDVAQTTTNAQPVFVTNGLGLNPVMRFAASLVSYGVWHTVLVATSSPTISQPISMSSVAKVTNNQNTWEVILGSNPLNGSLLFGMNSGYGSFVPDVAFAYASDKLLLASSTNGSFHSITGVFNGVSSSITSDSGTPTNGNANTLGLAATTTIGNAWGTSFDFIGDMTEVGVWPSAFNSSQTTSLHLNQKSYWGF